MTLNSVKKRLDEFDFIKGLLIVLVVWGHVCADSSGAEYEKNLLTTYIRLFQMPLFILVSGFFAGKADSMKSLLLGIKKKMLRIGIPYISWCLLSFGTKILTDTLLYHENNLGGYGLADLKHFMSAYWFFGCLMACSVVWLFISYLLQRNRWLGIVSCTVFTVVIFMIPFYVFHFQFLWPFYIVGVLYRKKHKAVKRWLTQKSGRICSILGLILFLAVGYHFPTSMTFYNMRNTIFVNGTGISEIAQVLVFMCVRYGVYLCGTLSMLVAMTALYRKIKNSRLCKAIVSLGRKTLFVFGFHLMILTWIYTPIVRMFAPEGLFGDFVRYYIYAPIFTTVLVSITMLLEKLCAKREISKFLFEGE